MERAQHLLSAAGVEEALAFHEARDLAACAVNLPRLEIHLQRDRRFSAAESRCLEGWLYRRLEREPLAYILKSQPFLDFSVEVTRATLIPRPETEILVERLLLRLPQGSRVADIGTGCGNIAVALALAGMRILATDISKEALRVARRNARRLGVGQRIKFFEGDLCAPLARLEIRGLDAVVSNPPYVANDEFRNLQPEVLYEPRLALKGGSDGLDFYRRISMQASGLLREGGLLAFEIASPRARKIVQILKTQGFRRIGVYPDLSGRNRVLIAQR